MAGSLNRVTLIGNLGRDPEVRRFDNGGGVCSFSLACSESWRDKNTGEKREKTEWINISVFSEGLIKVCESYLRKGSKVYVEGKFQTRKWQDQNGNDRYSTEVVIQGFGGQIIMLGGKNNDQHGGSHSGQAQGAQSSSDNSGDSSYNQGSNYQGDLDDEIPF